MPSTDWQTIQGKKGHGAGNVTDDQKNAIIDRAVSTGEGMGLTDPEKIAFGIAMMGLESGFDPRAVGKSPKSDEYGLGQFTKAGWDTAVRYYNKYRKEQKKTDWPAADVAAEEDPDVQIRVMGTWIPYVWERAGEIASDRALRGYNRKQITYGKWNRGQNAEADTVRKFLNKNWHDPNIGGYFDPNYDRAMQALGMREEARRAQPRNRQSLVQRIALQADVPSSLFCPGKTPRGRGSFSSCRGEGHPDDIPQADTGCCIGEDREHG